MSFAGLTYSELLSQRNVERAELQSIEEWLESDEQGGVFGPEIVEIFDDPYEARKACLSKIHALEGEMIRRIAADQPLANNKGGSNAQTQR